MADPSMRASGAPHNRLMDEMRAETVTKDDGRYLIYYSWPDDERAPVEERARAAGREQRPPQQPWSPEAGPSDV